MCHFLTTSQSLYKSTTWRIRNFFGQFLKLTLDIFGGKKSVVHNFYRRIEKRPVFHRFERQEHALQVV
jgi:hypothetical protein